VPTLLALGAGGTALLVLGTGSAIAGVATANPLLILGGLGSAAAGGLGLGVAALGLSAGPGVGPGGPGGPGGGGPGGSGAGPGGGNGQGAGPAAPGAPNRRGVPNLNDQRGLPRNDNRD